MDRTAIHERVGKGAVLDLGVGQPSAVSCNGGSNERAGAPGEGAALVADRKVQQRSYAIAIVKHVRQPDGHLHEPADPSG